MRLGFFSVKFYLILIGNFTRFISKAGIAFFPITSVLPAAFGKHNISVKVLGSISKKILIKTLQTEACEKCVVTGSLPKVISFYEKLECAHLHPLPRGHRPLLGGGGRMFPEVLIQTGNSAPEFLFFMSNLEAPAVPVTPVLSQLLCRM